VRNNPTNLGLAYAFQVMVRFARGDLAGAEEHFARGLEFFEDVTIWPLPLLRLTPLGVVSLNAGLLGRAELACERLAQMMAATKQSHPVGVVWSGYLGSLIYLLLRENQQAEMLVTQALELSEKYQIPYFAELAGCSLGLARARLGRPSEGVALIRQGIAGMVTLGMRIDVYPVFMAESQTLSGAIDDALATIERVLRPNRPDADKVVRPEAFRLRGELQMKQGRREPAEADFHTALTLARNMEAKALELRATMSLARLLRDTGRRDEAHTILAAIYNWFTEGFDTADLKEAKALLDELAT
jgi:tetratricopeptide (TPR) repeat protein